jgi:hypothetical protein
MDSGSDASSAASVGPVSPLDDVLKSEDVEVDVECTEYGQGGGGPDISIEEITILIILFHGTVRLTEIPYGGYTGVPIDVSNLSSIENLAYLAIAPTGLSNIGTNHELTAYKTHTESIFKSAILKHSIVESLKKIEKRADELVTKNASQPVSQPVKKISSEENTIGIFSRMCTYCFHFLKKSGSSILQLGNLITNYEFTNTFTVCKSVGAASLMGGNGMNLLKGGTKSTKRGRTPPSQLSMSQLSMSHDMFVVMLNELRLTIKDFDRERITKLCAETAQTTPDNYPAYYCKILDNMKERCRSLHILKGLGLDKSQLTGFINKDLSYNPAVDGPPAADGGKNMGVIKLQFRINSSKNVECSDTPYDPLEVMEAIKTNDPSKYGGVYWSDMEKCILYCTKDDLRSKTIFVIDLTCSSIFGAITGLIDQLSGRYIAHPGGGGKRIKKKSGSMKKTRRVKNKSRTTRYIMNRRNRLKHNKRTKKSRKTKTNRKH